MQMQKSHESGDKNCYQFLFKLLSKHFPEQIWTSKYNEMKNDPFNNGRSQNIHWKLIFNVISREGISKGVDSIEWRTLLKLLEIVRNPESYLMLNNKPLIKWKDQKSGKDIFLSKCHNTIFPNILCLLRSNIENSPIHADRKIIFSETFEGNNSLWDSLYRRPDDENYNPGNSNHSNNYYQNNEGVDYYGYPSKKLKTTMDFTFNTGMMDSKEEVIMEKEEYMSIENDNKIQNIGVGGVKDEEEKAGKIIYTGLEDDFNSFGIHENRYHGQSQNSNVNQERDDINDLKKQLEEMKRMFEVKEKESQMKLEEKDSIINKLKEDIEKMKNNEDEVIPPYHNTFYDSNDNDILGME